MANMRSDFSGRGELAERQQRLGQLMARLRKVGRRRRRHGRGGPAPAGGNPSSLPRCLAPPLQVAEEFNLAVLITNQASQGWFACTARSAGQRRPHPGRPPPPPPGGPLLQVMSDPSGGMTFVSDPKKPGVGCMLFGFPSAQRHR